MKVKCSIQRENVSKSTPNEENEDALYVFKDNTVWRSIHVSSAGLRTFNVVKMRCGKNKGNLFSLILSSLCLRYKVCTESSEIYEICVLAISSAPSQKIYNRKCQYI